MKIELYKDESACECGRNADGDIINCTCLLEFCVDAVDRGGMRGGLNFVGFAELNESDTENYLKEIEKGGDIGMYYDQESKRLYIC